MATAETTQSTNAGQQLELTADLRSAVFQLAWLYHSTVHVQEEELAVSDVLAIPASVEEDAQWEILLNASDRALEHLESNEDLIVGFAMSGKGKQASVAALIEEASEIPHTIPLRNRALLEIEQGLELLNRFGQQGATPQAAAAVHEEAKALSTPCQLAMEDLVQYGILPMQHTAGEKQSIVDKSLQDIRELTLPEINGSTAYINAEAALQALPLLSSTASELLLHLSGGISFAGKDHKEAMYVPWEAPGAAFASPTLQTPLPTSELEKNAPQLVEQSPLSATLAGEGICCALGLIGWKDKEDGDTARLAPLLLQPATVSDDDGVLTLKSMPSQPVINPVLAQLLAERYSIELPDYRESSNFTDYLNEVREVVETSRADLQIFDRAMLLNLPEAGTLYSDLAPDQWPSERQAANHAVVRRLLLGKIQALDEETLLAPAKQPSSHSDSPPIAAFPESLEVILQKIAQGESVDLANALDADERKEVLLSAIAEAAWNGRPALVVSSREETLKTIEDGLTEMGLEGLATRIYESRDEAPLLHDELKATLLQKKPRVPSPTTSMKKLQKKEGQLESAFAVLEDYRKETGQLASHTVAKLLKHNPNEATFNFEKMKNWDEATFREKQKKIERFEGILLKVGNPTQSCFYGSQSIKSLHGFEVKKLIEAAAASTETLKDTWNEFLNTFELSDSDDLEQETRRINLLQALTEFLSSDGLASFEGCNLDLIDEQGDLLKQLALSGRLYQVAEEKMPLAVEQEDDPEVIQDVRESLGKYQGSWMRFVSPRYWRTRSEAKQLLPDEFPPSFAERLEALDNLTKANENRLKLEERSVLLDKAFGDHHQGVSNTDWGFISRATLFLQSVRSSLKNNPEEDVLKEFLSGKRSLPEGALAVSKDAKEALEQYNSDIEVLVRTLEYEATDKSRKFYTTDFDAQNSLLSVWHNDADLVKDLTKYNEAAAELREVGLGFVCKKAERWGEDYRNFASAFEFSWLKGQIETHLSGNPEAENARSATYQKTVEEHTQAQDSAISIGRRAFALKHWKMMQAAEKAKDRDALRESIACDREEFSPRDFFRCKSSHLISPVVLGSPAAVATSLPRDTYFQLCVTDFDEDNREEFAATLGGLQRSSQLVMFSPFSDEQERSTRKTYQGPRDTSPLTPHIQKILEESGVETRANAEIDGVPVSLGIIDPKDSSRILAAIQIDDTQYLSVPSARDRDYLPGQKFKEHKVPVIFSSSLSWFDDFIAGTETEIERLLGAIPAEAQKS